MKSAFIALAALAIVAAHPYLFGIKGRIDEHLFASHLHVAMRQNEIRQWAWNYGGRSPAGGLTSQHSTYDPRNDGRLDVVFTEYETMCVSGGRDYQFLFSPDLKLTEWKVEPWGSAC